VDECICARCGFGQVLAFLSSYHDFQYHTFIFHFFMYFFRNQQAAIIFCSDYQFHAVPGSILLCTQRGLPKLRIKASAIFLFSAFYGFIFSVPDHIDKLFLDLGLTKTAVGKFHDLSLLNILLLFPDAEFPINILY